MKISNQNNTKTTIRAVGIIKSRKSNDKIMDMAEKMYQAAESLELDLLEVIVDDGFSNDIDRNEIDKVYGFIEKEKVEVVIFQSRKCITTDKADFNKFLCYLDEHCVLVVDLKKGIRPWFPICRRCRCKLNSDI